MSNDATPARRYRNIGLRRSGLCLTVMASVGAATTALAATAGAWPCAPVLGWNAASLTCLCWVLAATRRHRPAGTAAHTVGQAPEPAVSGLFLLAAADGLCGLGIVFIHAVPAQGVSPHATLALALASLALSWLLSHCILAVHCTPAPNDDSGPADLHTVVPARYQDFGHPSVATSKTHRTPQTHLQIGAAPSTAVCRALLSHALGAAALATAIPLVSGLSR